MTLRAERVDGSRIGVDAMSEGTRDQLYLALRLAALPPLRASAEFEATATSLTVTKASGQDGAGNRIAGNAAFDVGPGTTRGAFTADGGLSSRCSVVAATLTPARACSVR